MRRNVRLDWIAEVEARRFAESALIQHDAAEPTAGVVVEAPAIPHGPWVRRLVAPFLARSTPPISKPL